jgi:hypothetical protein
MKTDFVVAILSVCCGAFSCTAPVPNPERDVTLSTYSREPGIELSADHAGNVRGIFHRYSGGTAVGSSSAEPCPVLRAQVTVNGANAALDPGGGSVAGGPMPVYSCREPTFHGFVAGLAQGTPVDVNIWDETASWHVKARATVPHAQLATPDGLHVGTWAGLALDPVLDSVGIMFNGDGDGGGFASFRMAASRGGQSCPTETVVPGPTGLQSTSDAAAPCTIAFDQNGVSFLVPDIGTDVSGLLTVGYWWPTLPADCTGLARCWLTFDAEGTQEIAVSIPTRILR